MGQRWTEDEYGVLRDTSLSLAEVAERLGRTAHSVQQKAFRLRIDRVARRGGKGKARAWQRAWEEWELELLAEPDMRLTDVAIMTGRTFSAVRHKASRLGLVNIRNYWLRGNDHPNFRGGYGSSSEQVWRGRTWPEVRRLVLERDGYTCQDGGEFAPSGAGLHVHHVIPYRLRPVNDPRWLVTLCKSHHMSRPEHWWRDIPDDIAVLLGADAEECDVRR